MEAGLVMRNPGYGHPLRPEYIPTGRGSRVARSCLPLVALLRRLHLEGVGLKKWSMPLVGELRGGPKRFSELKATLPGLTARALALALKDLEGSALVERHVVDTYPPIAFYKLTPKGRRFAQVVRRIHASME